AVELTLEDVAAGADPTLEFERVDLCDTCGGNGCKPGSQPKRCDACGGYGQVQQQVQSIFGLSVRVQPCRQCNGKGSTVTDPCKSCDGTGRAKKRRVLTVHIPPGVHDGQVVRVRGEGEPNQANTSRGDMHVYVQVKEHAMLARRDSDLICQVPIAYSLAALGGSVEVPTLAGSEEIDVPAGTQNGDVITLKGRGLPSPRTGRKGHQQVVVYVEVPKKLTDTHKKLLRELAEIDQANVTPQRKSFLDKLKETFGLL
ncbi:MAG: DnaJ C-terminal domain-containing protein, partial [Planctomycetota bacterium]